MEEQVKKQKKPIYKKWWFWLIIAVVVIAIAVPTAESASNDREGGSNHNYYINSSVNLSNLVVKVTKAENTKVIGSGFSEKTTDNNFILVYVSVTNNTNSEKSLLYSNFYLYKDSAKYDVNSTGIYLDGGFWLSESIGSGLTKEFILVFETPTESTENIYKLEVKHGLKSQKITLRDAA